MPSDDGPSAEAASDPLAATCVEDVEESPYNADLAFPGAVDLVPEVGGRRILDAGCGAGVYTEWLLDRGAEVIGVDASEAMLERARERVGNRAEFRRADLADPLTFADEGSFDGIVSGLALGYIEDWRDPLVEFARLLASGGFLVCSIPHPFDEYPLAEDEDYFEIERRVKEWSVDIPYYRRPLSEMFEPLLETGFRIDAVSEPQPAERFRERWPKRYEKESKRPVFLCFRAVLV